MAWHILASRRGAVYTTRNEAKTADHMAKDKKKKRDSQLVIRIHKEERDAFVDLCEEMDTSASREIRRFMRDFVEQNEKKK